MFTIIRSLPIVFATVVVTKVATALGVLLLKSASVKPMDRITETANPSALHRAF